MVKRPTYHWSVSTLEERLLLAGDVGAAVAPAVANCVHSVAAIEGSVDVVATQPAKSIVFIDSGVEDAGALMGEAPSDADFVLIDSNRDGLQQITEALRSRQNVSAIHIVSHGDAGRIQLGNANIDIQTLQANDTMLRSWATSLSDDADILLYGCETGQGALGHQFAATFARLTGTDVAASSDLTGNAQHGSDWILETTVGDIENAIVFDASARKKLTHTLDIVINAWGQTGQEQFDLLIDGQVVQSYEAANTWTPFVYETDQPLRGDQVRIQFTNDAYDPSTGLDRNLFVNNIQVNGQNFETNSPDTFSTGTWLPGDGVVDGFGRGRILHANGFFQYGTVDPPTNGSTIVVNASGSDGTEQFVLRAGSETFQPTQVSNDVQSFTFQTENVVDANAIRVEFINDNYDPAAGIDSNLILDNVVVDGVVLEAEAPDVFTSAVWDPDSQRLSRGFFQTEVLNGNGFFQFAGDASESGLFELDPAFGQDGLVVASTGFLRSDFVESNDGRVSFVTSDVFSNEQPVRSVEYVHVHLPDGSPDSSFGGNGFVDIEPIVESFYDQDVRAITAEAVAFDSQGRVIVVGRSFFGTGNDRTDEGYILRLNADGTLDQSFANGPREPVSFFDTTHVIVDSSDRVVLGDSDGLSRLNSDGSVDTSFGTNGRVTFTGLPGFDSPGLNQLILDNGSIFAIAGRPEFGNPNSAAVIKLDEASGSLDLGYGENGYAFIPEATFSDNSTFTEAYDNGALDDQGRVVVAGTRSLIRIAADGSIDTSFGDKGLVVLPEQVVSEGDDVRLSLGDVVIDSQNRIVVENSNAIVRLNDDGSLDNTLSDDGFQRVDLTPEPGISFASLEEIILAGDDIIGVGSDFGNTILVKLTEG